MLKCFQLANKPSKDIGLIEIGKTICSPFVCSIRKTCHIDIISHEIDNWESLWLTHPVDKLPTNMSETIKAVMPVSFLDLSTVLRILGTLTITGCTCERVASSVQLLNTYLCSTMNQDRLNGLASLYTHKDIDVPIKKVIDKFA